MNYVINARGVTKRFKKITALRELDLRLEAGRVLGLLGPNGAGKTTLIRLLVGAIRPTDGEISVLGLHPIKQKNELRRQIGYMPQTPALYDDLSPRENIRFFGVPSHAGDLKKKVEEVIEFVGLTDRASYPVHTFSGGMKQRVSLGCALVNKPKVILLDEPTSGIDPKLREQFWQHFRHLADEGVTVLVSTHQMDDAMHCDELAIIHQGQVLLNKSPREILWENNAVVRIWRDGNLEEHRVKNYPDILPALLHSLGLDKNVKRIEIQEEGLEEVMLRLVKNKEEQELSA